VVIGLLLLSVAHPVGLPIAAVGITLLLLVFVGLLLLGVAHPVDLPIAAVATGVVVLLLLFAIVLFTFVVVGV
jgi:hypothetical protein